MSFEDSETKEVHGDVRIVGGEEESPRQVPPQEGRRRVRGCRSGEIKTYAPQGIAFGAHDEWCKELGKRIRSWRLIRGRTQQSLADEMGASSAAVICHWEWGRRVPSTRSLLMLCKALQVDLPLMFWGLMP